MQSVDSWWRRFPRSVVPRYIAYWRRASPGDLDDVFRRWLFAFCSIRTTWLGATRGYSAIREFAVWMRDRRRLVEQLRVSGIGLHNSRADYILDFSRQFWKDPPSFVDGDRDELVEKVRGLGAAKISFALNLIQPLLSRVVCFDIHMLRLYRLEELDYKTTRGMRIYRRAERDWIRRCDAVPPYIGHSIYWDRVHGETNSDYWGHVLTKG